MPWGPVQVVYEHYHRYLWAARMLQGARVLDLASGEGFGAAILAGVAGHVVGLDLDERAVSHSSLNYAGGNLEFRVGDGEDLSQFEGGAFDAVVAFEMIEHVEHPERVLTEIRRVLREPGILIMSTPERLVYTEASGEVNPFHTREFTESEFRAFLDSTFPKVEVWGQRAVSGSALAPLVPHTSERPGSDSFFLQRNGDEWHAVERFSPRYLVALATAGELPLLAAGSWLGDPDLALVHEERGHAESRMEAESVVVREEIAEVRRVAELRTAELRREVEAAQLERQAASELLHLHEAATARAERAIGDREVELDYNLRQLEQVRKEVDVARAGERAGREELERKKAELDQALRYLARVQGSVVWRLFERVRFRVFRLLGGERSPATRMLQFVLRSFGRALDSGPAPASSRPPETVSAAAPAWPSVVFPQWEHPEVSIVVPVYAHANLTLTTLESIALKTHGVSYEVIIVDDTADADCKALLSEVRGARILVNEVNLGYLHSVNRAAAEAGGEWLVLANNDIDVREGWLKALLACGRSSEDVAAVTPQYLMPDGTLLEAGGIIWRDGTGVNYGRGQDPGQWRYQYRREVDYGSAAALLVRRRFWEELGGYDTRYEPMYYEDADLGFEARARGMKVMYEPAAQVFHNEGSTAGTDVSAGPKHHQEINRHRFVDKWQEVLEREHLRPSPHSVERAASRRTRPHVLIIDHRVPMWDRDAGSLRMLGIIESLLELDYRISFMPDDGYPAQPYTRALQAQGVEVWYGDFDRRAELATVASTVGAVLACRPHPTSRWLDTLRELAPSARVAYDTVDLHWLREARRDGVSSGRENVGGFELGPKARALRELELALIRATDVTVVVTQEEREQVEADVPGALVAVIPIMHRLRTTSVPPRAGRRGVVFVGGFEHSPNIDGAVRLVRRVMPIVWRELGEVPVRIIGSNAPAEVEQLASPMVEIMGWVEDLGPILDEAVALVAPLSYGAGLKGKVTQALSYGLPVVTTPIGAEGLDAADGEQLLVGLSDVELADRTIRVLRDRDLWQRLSQNGRELVLGRCAPQLIQERLLELLNRVQEPAKHR